MDSHDLALAPRDPANPPKLVLASSLDQATAHSLLYIDRHGQVQSPTRYRAFTTLGYLSLGGIAALPVLYGMWFGPIGAAIGAGVSGWAALRVRHNFAAQRAARFLAYNRAAEAERILTGVVTARLTPRYTRAVAYRNLAVCRAMQGDTQTALKHVGTALRTLGRTGRTSLQATLTRYLEIHLLVNLDRVAEARDQLHHLGPPPTGEYLRTVHWTAELYVCLGADELTLSEDEVYPQARKALAMTTGSPLLGLTAWAFTQLGDDDQAAHLLAEAFDRLDDGHAERRLECMMPRLYTWMTAHRPAAPDV